MTLQHSDESKEDIIEKFLVNGLLQVEKRKERRLAKLVSLVVS